MIFMCAWLAEEQDGIKEATIMGSFILYILILGFIGIYRGGYELDDIIENYREKRWKRFPRK